MGSRTPDIGQVGEPEIRELAAARHGAGISVQMLPTRYGTNRVFLIHWDGEQSRVLKLYRCAKRAQVEEAALRAVAQTCSLAETPRVLASFEVCFAGGSFAALELSRVPGAAREEDHGRRGHQQLAAFGDLLRRVHAAPHGGRWGHFLPGAGGSESWVQYLRDRAQKRGAILVDRMLVSASDVQFVLAEIRASGDYLSRHIAPSLLHRDLNPDNILVDGRGEVALIDFEVAMTGHWAWDLISFMQKTARGCEGCLQAVAAGYGFDLEDERLSRDLKVYRLVYCLDMAAYLAMASRSEEDVDLLEELLGEVRRLV